MKLELEVKFFPIDKEAIRKSISSSGGVLKQKETLMRRAVYDHRKNPTIKCTYARIRDEGDKITASLKVNAEQGGSIYDQKEAQLIVNSFEDTREFFKGLGLVETNYQENYRETWELDGCEIVIDSWPALDTYIEIEAETEELIKQTSSKLDLDWDNRIFVSTDELYAKKYSITKEEALETMANLTFDNIPDRFKVAKDS